MEGRNSLPRKLILQSSNKGSQNAQFGHQNERKGKECTLFGITSTSKENNKNRKESTLSLTFAKNLISNLVKQYQLKNIENEKKINTFIPKINQISHQLANVIMF